MYVPCSCTCAHRLRGPLSCLGLLCARAGGGGAKYAPCPECPPVRPRSRCRGGHGCWRGGRGSGQQLQRQWLQGWVSASYQSVHVRTGCSACVCAQLGSSACPLLAWDGTVLPVCTQAPLLLSVHVRWPTRGGGGRQWRIKMCVARGLVHTLPPTLCALCVTRGVEGWCACA